jgi:hypothetical protein
MSGRSVAKVLLAIAIVINEGRMSAASDRIQQLVLDLLQRGRTSQFANEEPRL